jgi:hypothetical protein
MFVPSAIPGPHENQEQKGAKTDLLLPEGEVKWQ